MSNPQHKTPEYKKAAEIVAKLEAISREEPFFIMSPNQIRDAALIMVDEIINCDSYFPTQEDLKPFSDFWSGVQDHLKCIEIK